MKNYTHIEKLDKAHKHYTGYGANGEIYTIRKTGLGWCASCKNANVQIRDFARNAKTLAEINDWLGGLSCQK